MKLSLLMLTSLLVVSSCATKKTHEVIHQQASQEVGTKQGLAETIDEVITNSTSLSDKQKSELMKLLKSNKATVEKYVEQSFQLRSVLIRELLSGDVSDSRVSVLKKDIKKIEDARLKNSFDTIEKIKKIVGKDPSFSDRLNKSIQHTDRFY